MTIRSTIPGFVDNKIGYNIGELTHIADTLSLGAQTDARFNGGGRYVADVVTNKFGTLKALNERVSQHWAALQEVQHGCPENVDFDALLGEYDPLPTMEALTPSVAAQEWLLERA